MFNRVIYFSIQLNYHKYYKKGNTETFTIQIETMGETEVCLET